MDLRSWIRRHTTTHKLVHATWCRVVNATPLRRRGVSSTGGGTTPPPHSCPTGQHWDSALARCVVDTLPPPPSDKVFTPNIYLGWSVANDSGDIMEIPGAREAFKAWIATGGGAFLCVGDSQLCGDIQANNFDVLLFMFEVVANVHTYTNFYFHLGTYQ